MFGTFFIWKHYLSKLVHRICFFLLATGIMCSPSESKFISGVDDIFRHVSAADIQ